MTLIISIDFNHVRSLLQTNGWLFEIEVQEMPNMVKVAALPRQIAHRDRPPLRHDGGASPWPPAAAR